MNRVLIPPLAHPPRRPRGAVIRPLSGQTMGTTWSAKIAAANIEISVVEAAIQRELDLVVAQMSPWEPDSALSRFNRLPTGSWLQLPVEFAQVLRCALDVAEATDGAFDPTLGALTDLWGFGPAPFSGAPPEATDIRRILASAGWRRVRLENGRVFQPGGLVLDLCGIAKGFAVDRAGQALARLGVTSYLVEIGGELRGRGVKPDCQPWWVELETPAGRRLETQTLVALLGTSVATSGGYRRFFDHRGRRYAHTLDPAEGRPVAEVLSVNVLHKDCMVADALATALVAMGADRAQAFVEARGIAARIVVGDEPYREMLSSAMEAMTDC